MIGCASDERETTNSNTLKPHIIEEDEHLLIDVGAGIIVAPKDYKHIPGKGIDTKIGEIISGDGKIAIRYDIGAMAGNYASSIDSNKIIERKIYNTNNYIATMVLCNDDKRKGLCVTYEKPCRMNFIASITDDSQIQAVLNIALSIMPYK